MAPYVVGKQRREEREREKREGFMKREREIKVWSKHLSTHRDLDCKL
jgi:hypothetical protein